MGSLNQKTGVNGEFVKRLSPRLHKNLDSGNAGELSAVGRRFSPRLHKDSPVIGIGASAKQTSVGRKFSPKSKEPPKRKEEIANHETEPDYQTPTTKVTVKDLNLQTRMSPRLHGDSGSEAEKEKCDGSSASLGIGPDVQVISLRQVERRFSPRLNGVANGKAELSNDASIQRNRSPSVQSEQDCEKESAFFETPMQRRSSPRLHCEKQNENKMTVEETPIQRRVSPRLHGEQKNENQKALLETPAVGKRALNGSHADKGFSGKRSKHEHVKGDNCKEDFECSYVNEITCASNGEAPHQLALALKLCANNAKKQDEVADVAGRSDHARVKETLRIFNTYYLQFVQEEEERRKKNENDREEQEKSSKSKGDHRKYTLPIAVAVVLSGQYEDNTDNADDIIYTGQGGNDLLGNKLQREDQVMIRGNLALKNSMDQSVPIRVVRGHKNTDSYSGKIYSFDGLYKVVETWADKGCRGHLVYKYRLVRIAGQPKLTTDQVQFVRGRPLKVVAELPGLVCRDISNGLEDICIPVTNVVDDPPVAPPGFTYMTSIEVAASVKLPPNATGCSCKGTCSNPNTCACAKLNGSDFPYVRRDGGRLVEAKDIVFECGPNCGCKPGCLNRISQRRIKYRLEVYRTPDKGWAVRSWDFIPSGAPVCEYIGVLRRSDELDNSFGNEYIFEIDCLHTINEIEGRERRFGNVSVSSANAPMIDKKTLDGTPEFCIDAGSRGNVARFINHSCEPNLFVQCILSAHHDLRLARVVLIAADNISPMQELTYDYGYALDSVIGPDGKIKVLPCFCGTADCRKRLY
ncbi:Histone-lysine N-methyltransferase H3 lysine-9 specific SUVH4 [Bienertia sinuspersici]